MGDNSVIIPILIIVAIELLIAGIILLIKMSRKKTVLKNSERVRQIQNLNDRCYSY